MEKRPQIIGSISEGLCTEHSAVCHSRLSLCDPHGLHLLSDGTLVQVYIAVINVMTKSNLGRRGLFSLCFLNGSQSREDGHSWDLSLADT